MGETSSRCERFDRAWSYEKWSVKSISQMNFEEFLTCVGKKNSYCIGPIGERQSVAATRATVRLLYIAWLKGVYSQNKKYPLSRLLNEIDHAEATLLQDNMFALLGLSSESDVPALAPDYNEFFKGTATRYALYFLRTQNSLDLLSSSGLGQRTRLSELPSWMPLWTSSMRESRLNFVQSDGSAYHHASASSVPETTLFENLGILDARGVVIDCLSVVHNSRWSDHYHGLDYLVYRHNV
jgi:hypothetical protein